ncbi:MAG: hypothetical protein ACKOAL_08135, partial [Chthoniobacterales bacterium]
MPEAARICGEEAQNCPFFGREIRKRKTPSLGPLLWCLADEPIGSEGLATRYRLLMINSMSGYLSSRTVRMQRRTCLLAWCFLAEVTRLSAFGGFDLSLYPITPESASTPASRKVDISDVAENFLFQG